MFSAQAIIFAEYLQKQQWSRLRNSFNLRKKYDNPAVETLSREPIIHPGEKNGSNTGEASRASPSGLKGRRTKVKGQEAASWFSQISPAMLTCSGFSTKTPKSLLNPPFCLSNEPEQLGRATRRLASDCWS